MSKQILAMRKNCLFAAIGATSLMLASCSADESVALNTLDGAINYTVVADNQTRALHSYCNNNLPESFYVWTDNCDDIKGNLITKQSDGNYIDGSGIKYWPDDETSLSFYAVADGNFTPDANGKVTSSILKGGKAVVENYTIKDNVGEQLDLMYAVTTGVTKNQTVQFNFRHALSQICFNAQNEIPDTRITINEITVGNVYYKGSFTLPTGSTTENFEDHSTSSSSSSVSNERRWTVDDTAVQNYTIDLRKDTNNDGTKEVGVQVDSDGESHPLTYETGAHNTKWYGNVLNLLPQKKTINVKLKLTIEEKVEEKDGTITYIGSSKPIPDPDISININWEEGIRYIYTFKFTEDWLKNNLGAFTYSVTVDDFKNDNFNPHFVIDGHEAVLMRKAVANGDPDLYVATTNIDANTPSDFGKYFWWGDTKGHTLNDGFNFIEDGKVSTMNLTIEQLKAQGYITDDEILTKTYDVAYQKWGGSWHIPTKADLEWLVNEENCTWHWETTPVKGYTVVSQTTGGSIFLPAAGCIEGTNMREPEVCYYWSSQPEDVVMQYGEEKKDKKAWRLRGAGPANPGVSNIGNRTDGFPIRPVVGSTTPSSQD